MKCVSLKKTVLMSLLLSTVTPTAHAGLSDAINNYFTFREEQKPLVAPNRDLPPLEVITPSYNDKRARDWSNYYSRKDLEAVPHLDNSSRVMRKRVLTPDEMAAIRKQATIQQGYEAYPHDNIYAQTPRGPSDYDRIVRRDATNHAAEMQAQDNFYIGEPGTSPSGRHLYESGAAGMKTQIDDPRYKWNEEPQNNAFATPREGDYDYARKIKHRRAEDISKEMMKDQGYELTRSSGYGYSPYDERLDLRNRGGQPIPVTTNDGQAPLTLTEQDMVQLNQNATPYPTPTEPMQNGQELYNGHHTSHARIALPDRYTVEPSDTLSHISEKDIIYGDWKLWPLIYDANRNQIQDPDLIYPGQDLGIPRDSTEPQQNNARSRALDKNAPYDFYDGQ